MLDDHIELLKGAFVEQKLDPFPRRQLALIMLGVDPPLAAAETRRRPLGLKLFDDFGHVLSTFTATLP